jgi:hypothetical protein
MFGLEPPPETGEGEIPLGASVRVDTGAVSLLLVPRPVEQELRAQLA